MPVSWQYKRFIGIIVSVSYWQNSWPCTAKTSTLKTKKHDCRWINFLIDFRSSRPSLSFLSLISSKLVPWRDWERRGKKDKDEKYTDRQIERHLNGQPDSESHKLTEIESHAFYWEGHMMIIFNTKMYLYRFVVHYIFTLSWA